MTTYIFANIGSDNGLWLVAWQHQAITCNDVDL